jgi:hypothetical protein
VHIVLKGVAVRYGETDEVKDPGNKEEERKFKELQAIAKKINKALKDRGHRPAVCIIDNFEKQSMKHVMAASTFVFAPSEFEPQGLGIMESARYGAIVVGSRTGGHVDQIRDITMHCSDINSDETKRTDIDREIDKAELIENNRFFGFIPKEEKHMNYANEIRENKKPLIIEETNMKCLERAIDFYKNDRAKFDEAAKVNIEKANYSWKNSIEAHLKIQERAIEGINKGRFEEYTSIEANDSKNWNDEENKKKEAKNPLKVRAPQMQNSNLTTKSEVETKLKTKIKLKLKKGTPTGDVKKNNETKPKGNIKSIGNLTRKPDISFQANRENLYEVPPVS